MSNNQPAVYGGHGWTCEECDSPDVQELSSRFVSDGEVGRREDTGIWEVALRCRTCGHRFTGQRE